MLQICSIIRQARLSKGMSQEKIAGLLDEKRSTYAEWEKNTEPKVSVFMKIAEILEINPLEVFTPHNINADKMGVIERKILDIQASLDSLKDIFVSPNSPSPSGTTQERQRTTESDNAAKQVHKIVKRPSEGNTSGDGHSEKPGKKDEEDKTRRG